MATQNAHGPFPVPFEMNIPALHKAEEAGATAVFRNPQDPMKLMPASVRSKKHVIERADITMGFLEKELSIPRLNDIHDLLWLAGRPMPPRALNYQVASSRAITVTEDVHLHLVWESGRIFLKPLPRSRYTRGLSLLWRGFKNRELEDLMRGYKFEFATYGQQFAGYLTPILAATAYIALVLTAMQVGLGTDTLRESVPFQRASYGFTVFSILTPLILVATAAFMVLLFVLFNYFSTKTYLCEKMAFYANLGP